MVKHSPKILVSEEKATQFLYHKCSRFQQATLTQVFQVKNN